MGLLTRFLQWIFGSPQGRPDAAPRPPQAPTGVPYQRPSAGSANPTSSGSTAPQRASGLAGLDAGRFTPLTDAEIKKKGQGIRWTWSSVNFDRRDQIPPASEPRTALIESAMVAHGLVTPEELAAMHAAGDEMAILRPALGGVHAAGERAVAADEEQRRAIKAAKKAESEARRQARAEAVVRRKATDIVFLGRGVSSGLSDRRANIERLHALNLPVIAAPEDLAKVLELPIPRLRWLAFHSEAPAVTHYVRFQIPKKSGGTRELATPHRDLARCQNWIRVNILDRVPLHPAAHGFVAGRSTMSNAVPHVRRAVVANADLKDFFPTITFPRVRGVFQELGYSPCVATILALLCTECPRRAVVYGGRELFVATGPRGLPQGACTSPALSNLVARGLDGRLAGVARVMGWDYTRYADDLTFSADGEAGGKVGWLLARLRHIAQEEGFTVNEAKTRVQRQNSRQTVTGIVVNKRPNVPREIVRRIRAILHRAEAEGLEAQNRENLPHFEAWVGGMIAYIHMVHPERGRALKAKFDAVRRSNLW